ncbi:MAG: prepilin-type N-terminal cleavage/methylation domain-containing protein [Thermodesulfobacteriota bacterium]
MKVTGYIKLQQRSQTTDDGFTLIEVLLAVFIASLVIAVLYASFFQILKAKDKVEQELELYHESRVIFSKITKDLATAFTRGSVNSTGNDSHTDYFVGSQEGNHSTLRFSSLSRSPAADAKESDQTEISYFVENAKDADDPQLLALIRRDDPTIGTDGGGSEYPISERVVGFTLSYIGPVSFAAQNEELNYEWNSNESSSLPNAVNVNIVLRGPNNEDVEFNSLVLIPVVD